MITSKCDVSSTVLMVHTSCLHITPMEIGSKNCRTYTWHGYAARLHSSTFGNAQVGRKHQSRLKKRESSTQVNQSPGSRAPPTWYLAEHEAGKHEDRSQVLPSEIIDLPVNCTTRTPASLSHTTFEEQHSQESDEIDDSPKEVNPYCGVEPGTALNHLTCGSNVNATWGA